MNLVQLQNKIHEQNKSVGWWDEPRDFSTITNLGISELSESLEGDRKSLPDDKLTHYPMVVVELADFIIRTMDYLGSVGNEFYPLIVNVNDKYREGDYQFNLALCSWLLTQAWNMKEIQNDDFIYKVSLRAAVIVAIRMIKDMGCDWEKIILEKVEFNRTRQDHQRENRQGETGQKKY